MNEKGRRFAMGVLMIFTLILFLSPIKEVEAVSEEIELTNDDYRLIESINNRKDNSLNIDLDTIIKINR